MIGSKYNNPNLLHQVMPRLTFSVGGGWSIPRRQFDVLRGRMNMDGAPKFFRLLLEN